MKTIYLHRNKFNNKVYIGQTIQTPEERWKKGKGYKNNPYFDAAIQKYGWDNFEHIILEQSEEWSQEELDNKEREYIRQYRATEPQYGYNITEGGGSTTPNALPKALEWMKEHPEFGLARAQDMLKWQKEHPEEALAYRRINAKKATEARKRKVECIETGEVCESASEAARHFPKTSQSKICMVCRGQRNTCGGYHWRYVIEGDK